MQVFLSRVFDALVAGSPNVLIALIIFIVSVYFAGVFSGLLRRVLQARRAPLGVTHLLSQLIRWTIIVFGIITALQRFFDVTAFLTGLGIIGFTVGFALQDTMKNLTGGIILLIQRPFQIGEVVGIAGFDGTVLNIDMRTTDIETTDGRIVTLPNANILAGPIINYTRARRARVDLSLSLPPGTDPAGIRQAVISIAKDVAGYVPDPAPLVVFDNLTSGTLDLKAGFWIDLTKNSPAEAKDAVLVKIEPTLKLQNK